MSTDAGNAAPEDVATREVSAERPGLESEDPGAADSATATPETADRGVEGSADTDSDTAVESDSDTAADSGRDSGGAGDSETHADSQTHADSGAAGDSGERGADADTSTPDPATEGFVATMLRDATITGLPGDTGAPPAEPHAPEAQQEGDEPVGSEPPSEDERDH